jgi:hypothetical protein
MRLLPLGESCPLVSGPYETREQVRDRNEARAAWAAWHADPEPGKMAPHLHRMLDEACAAARDELGAYDHRILTWMAGWEAETVAVIAGIIRRAAAGGR